MDLSNISTKELLAEVAARRLEETDPQATSQDDDWEELHAPRETFSQFPRNDAGEYIGRM